MQGPVGLGYSLLILGAVIGRDGRVDFSKEIASLQDARKGRLELRREIDKDIKKIEGAIDALGAPYLAPKVKPDKIESNRKVLEILQERPRSIRDVFFVLQQQEYEGIKTEGGVRQVMVRLKDDDKVEVVEDTFPHIYKVKRDLKIVAGEGAVS